MVNQDKLSPTGKDWLLCSLDPFHDSQISNIEGWPDMECGASVVRCVKQSFSASRPPAWSASENFDIHVVMWPFVRNEAFMLPAQRYQTLHAVGPLPPDPANVRQIGGLQVYAVKSGQDLDLDPASATTVLLGTMALSKNITMGSGRLLGMGYEVHNTTADIYKQGSACCYRQQADVRSPSTHMVCGSILPGPTAANGAFSLNLVRHPPSNLEDAMLIQGSRQWTAEEGMYQVAAFYSSENPARPIDGSVPGIYYEADYEDVETEINPAAVLLPVPFSGGTGSFNATLTVQPLRVHPIHQSGSIFTGLSPQSTLTVNWNVFYESFPAIADDQILPLAKPSAVYDPLAMELYSRTVQELPVGVPVRENGLGDWFLDAASTAAKYLGPVIGAMPHPIAKGAGAALTYLGETGQNYVKKQVPPNAWEQGGNTAALTKAEARDLVKGAKAQQKKKDKKKVQKAQARAAARK